ncbi:MAG: hypothetical protein V3S30_00670 [Thermoanaerobaculia bacterium]
MKRFLTSVLLVGGFGFSIGTGVIGCAARSPEERVASIRARYKATLNSFIVQEPPVEVAVEPMPESMDPVDNEDMPADDSTESLDIDAVPAAAVSTNVLLDILLQHRSSEKLDGITVDISMIDAEQHEKGHWRVWFDTSTLEKANISSRIHILEDPDYEEGDGFAAEVRPIPEAERADYREFSSAQ